MGSFLTIETFGFLNNCSDITDISSFYPVVYLQHLKAGRTTFFQPFSTYTTLPLLKICGSTLLLNDFNLKMMKNLVWLSVLEKKSIWAEFGFSNIVYTLVVQVTLLRVGKETVGLGASKIYKKEKQLFY